VRFCGGSPAVVAFRCFHVAGRHCTSACCRLLLRYWLLCVVVLGLLSLHVFLFSFSCAEEKRRYLLCSVLNCGTVCFVFVLFPSLICGEPVKICGRELSPLCDLCCSSFAVVLCPSRVRGSLSDAVGGRFVGAVARILVPKKTQTSLMCS
jgi:hypothetical protein